MSVAANLAELPGSASKSHQLYSTPNSSALLNASPSGSWRPGVHESWLLSPEVNGAELGWTTGGGLGADLGRSEPVIQDEVEELVNTVTHGLGLILTFYMRGQRRFFHGLWHVFVVAGSICHYRAIVGCLATLAG
jgi:hypothetical protein